jgi:3'-5' exoribonuclease
MMSEAYHADKGPFLRDLQPGDRFVGYYVLRSKQLEPFRDASRGYYLTLILSDRSGQLLARVWEGAEDVDAELVQGEVVKVDGEVETYLERIQIRVLRIRPAPPKEYDIRDMLPSSDKNPEEMLTALQEFIDRISNPHLSALVNAFYGDKEFIQLFSQAPAARRIHHAYIHGLLEHTLELLIMADTLLALYPRIDADLLTAGILLHDIGKVREYSWELDIDYTNEGRLIGHIVMGDEMITEAIRALPDFPDDLTLALRHMALSHHGRYSWGSPRRPKMIEAIALHHLENLSAQVNRFHLLLDKRPSGDEWTAYDRLLGRQLYSGGDGDLSIEEDSLQE